jgi:hypothetical protein
MAGSCWGHWHRSNGISSWVLKLGANGTEKWSRVYYSWASDPNDICRDLAIDEENNSFLLLRSSVESVSQSKVVKYSPSGEMRWVAQHYSLSGVFEDPSAITVDGQGCIHLAGYLEQPNVFSWCEALQVRQYATAALLAKFDTNGSLVWATDSGFTNFQQSYHGPSIVSSSDGNIIVTGQQPNCLQTDLTLKKYAISPLPGTPQIEVAPQNQTIEMGAAAVFTVIATGAPPLYFQWYINDQPLLGCTNSEMTYDGYCPSPTAFSFSVVITNEIGFTRSPEVRATFPAKFTVLGREPGGAIQLNTEGGYYERFVIQVSTNLVDWSLLTRVQGYNPFYQDPGATTLPRRFYRCLHQ